MKSNQTSKETKKMGFELNTLKVVRGTRRLVREKILQILVAHFISDISIELLIDHIFNRDFIIDNEIDEADKNFHISKNVISLDEEQMANLTLDALIQWRDEDIEFGKNIMYFTIQNYNDFVDYIKEASEHWDFNRITVVDRVAIMIATAEFISAPDIPIKVSINEALELAKVYSTEKSPSFVNGMLEKIRLILEERNLINKSERGLK